MDKDNKFQIFRKINPLDFSEVQFMRVEEDIQKERGGIVSDEYVDFRLWTKGLPSRQESFATYISSQLPLEQYPRLLEVGAGRNKRLSKLLSKVGYEMAALDPQISLEDAELYN